jgi:hypothetical protein
VWRVQGPSERGLEAVKAGKSLTVTDFGEGPSCRQLYRGQMEQNGHDPP